jgi:hypothetical protein
VPQVAWPFQLQRSSHAADFFGKSPVSKGVIKLAALLMLKTLPLQLIVNAF